MIKANRNRRVESRGKSLNSKAMGAIVATSLLIVVTVVASIGFQGWFIDFESGLTTEVEKQSMNTQLRVDGIFGDTLYLYLGDETVLSSLKIVDNSGNEMCSFTDSNSNLSSLNTDPNLVLYLPMKEVINNGTHNYTPDLSGNNFHTVLTDWNIFRYSSNSNNNQILSIMGNNLTIKHGKEYPFNSFKNCILSQNQNTAKILEDINFSINLDNVSMNRTFILNTSDGFVTNQHIYLTCNEYPILTENGFYFNGKTSYLIIDNILGTSLEMDFPEDNITMIAFAKDIGVGNNGWGCNSFITNFLSSYRYNLGIRSSNARFFPQNLLQELSDPSFNRNNNYHLSVFTNNGTDYFYYRNSHLKHQTEVSSIEKTSSYPIYNNLQIGRTNHCGGTYFKGYVKEVRIYNRTLSENEISTLYWYSIKNNQQGVNQLDISSCNLNKGETYNIVGFTNNQKVEGVTIKK